tara:strand:- start:146 stop:718 length:573 start_codon:yes stop_codon:yes gene_type:complete
MKNLNDLSKKDIKEICDYLKKPSIDEADDKKRFNKIKKILAPNAKKGGPVGEAIVRIYYEKLKKNYYSNPQQQNYVNKLGKKIGVRPDGCLIENEDTSYWVESKIRRYQSNGTAHEKVPNVPMKYRPIGGQVILFLLADDEHRYNTEWTAVCRGEIDPEDDAEEFRKKADTSVLKEIILGTEVAKALEKI